MNEKRVSLTDYDLMGRIEQGLNRFGPALKYAVMWRMVIMGESPKERILVKFKGFLAALQSIFGPSAKVIEQSILVEVKARAECEEFSEMHDLADLLNEIRRRNILDPLFC